MHGRKSLVIIAALFLTSCSPNSIMKPDCHSCTVEDQAWNTFSWSALPGQWKGSVETFTNEKGKKKAKVEAKAELRFLSASEFLAAQKAPTCGSLPANAVVMNGRLWDATGGSKAAPARTEYEAFVPSEGDKVAYGRISFASLNGERVCHFRQLGSVMGQNRLALPTVSFSENSRVSLGRTVASLAPETEVSVEFLRFAPTPAKNIPFAANGRAPASAGEREKPALMLRVYKLSTRNSGPRGEWSGSEEQLYRLWKTE